MPWHKSNGISGASMRRRRRENSGSGSLQMAAKNGNQALKIINGNISVTAAQRASEKAAQPSTSGVT